MSERLSKIADRYEELISKGLEFIDVDRESLDDFTLIYLDQILNPAGLEYSIATVRLDNTVLFKIEHPEIAYLHHDPVEGKHMWADVGFHNALDNNRVLAMMAELSGVLLSSTLLLRMFGVKDGQN